MRGIQYAAASRLIAAVSGILGRPVRPGDDSWVCGGSGVYAAFAFASWIPHHTQLVILRESGGSSTPRPLDQSPASLEYWVARSSRAMTVVGVPLPTPLSPSHPGSRVTL